MDPASDPLQARRPQRDETAEENTEVGKKARDAQLLCRRPNGGGRWNLLR
jgi:hypothetical protein